MVKEKPVFQEETTMNLRRSVLFCLILSIAILAAGQGFRESVRVGLVTVRLEVRGPDGQPLRDLKASEIRLKVDGKNVPIEGLDLVEAAPVPAAAPKPPEAAPTAAPQTADVPPAVLPPSPDLYLAILLDETSSNSFDRRDVYRQIEKFLTGRMAPGVHVMLERYDGQLRIECPWTTDASRLLAAARKMSKRTFDSRVPSPSALADEIHNGRRPRDLELEIDLTSRRSFDGISQALLQFPAGIPGRMGLVYISDGTPLLTPFDLSLTLSAASAGVRDSGSQRARALGEERETAADKQIEEQLRQDSLSTMTVFGAGSDATWVQRVAAITKKALELDIAFYPVDSEAIERGANPGVSSKWPGRSMPGVQRSGALPSGSGMTARVAVAQSMETLAATTGGQTILVPNQFSDRLGTVVDGRSSGYALTFRDPAPGDFRLHRIAISVARPGAKLAYRRGYRVPSDEDRTLDTLIANLSEPRAENPLQAKVSFEELRKESGRDIVAMRLEYPQPPEAPAPPMTERDIQIWAVCSDAEGNRAKPITRKAKAQRVSADRSAPFFDSIQLGLPPGPYVWSIALRDSPSGLTSYLVVRKTL